VWAAFAGPLLFHTVLHTILKNHTSDQSPPDGELLIGEERFIPLFTSEDSAGREGAGKNVEALLFHCPHLPHALPPSNPEGGQSTTLVWLCSTYGRIRTPRCDGGALLTHRCCSAARLPPS
jgi:hypothetical protein